MTRTDVIMFIGLGVLALVVMLLVLVIWKHPPLPPSADRQAAGHAQPVLFIGSSTIARFPLDDLFPDKPWRNLGKPDESAVLLRDRLAKTDIPAPAGIVLYAGSIDFRLEPHLSPKEVRERVEAVVDDLLKRFPKLGMQAILLLEILPARKQTVAERDALDAVNRELADLAAARHPDVKLLQTNRPPLVDQNGDLLESMSVDNFHLNEAGYRILAKWLQEDGGAVGQMLR